MQHETDVSELQVAFIHIEPAADATPQFRLLDIGEHDGGVEHTQPVVPVEIIGAITNFVTSTLVSSGLALGMYRVAKTWVNARNGRKLKIRIGDIEVEATQMKEEDVFRIFELLEEKADRKKIRELLMA